MVGSPSHPSDSSLAGFKRLLRPSAEEECRSPPQSRLEFGIPTRRFTFFPLRSITPERGHPTPIQLVERPHTHVETHIRRILQPNSTHRLPTQNTPTFNHISPLAEASPSLLAEASPSSCTTSPYEDARDDSNLPRRFPFYSVVTALAVPSLSVPCARIGWEA